MPVSGKSRTGSQFRTGQRYFLLQIVESAAELEILEELAAAKNKVASIALRINPEVDAHTHAKITTGMKENKFGINLSQLGQVLDLVCRLEHIKFDRHPLPYRLTNYRYGCFPWPGNPCQ